MANNPTALDFNDLIYYDKKIKEYVDDKANSIAAIIPDTYTKDEIDSKLDLFVSKAVIIAIDQRIDKIAEDVAANTATIVSHREELDDIEAAIIVLQEDDKQTRQDIANIELKLESKATLADIPTKTSQLTNDSGYLTEIPEEYVTDDELRDAINSIDIPEIDLTDYYTKEETDALIPSDYVKEEELSNYTTHEELETAVTELVDTHFEETVIVHVDEEIEKKLAENQTINYGTFGEEL